MSDTMTQEIPPAEAISNQQTPAADAIHSAENRRATAPAKGSSDSTDLCSRMLLEIQAAIPPLWPLQDYVAVNPFFGWAHKSFLQVRQQLAAIRDCKMLMAPSYYRTCVQQGLIQSSDVETALQRCASDYPELYRNVAAKQVMEWVMATGDQMENERQVRTVAETVDACRGSLWQSHIVNDVSRHLSSHFDQGQALWNSPWQGQPLFQAWRQMVVIGRRMELLGIRNFRQFVSDMPESPAESITRSLELLGVPQAAWKPFLLCQLHSVSGWASFLRYQGWSPGSAESLTEDLVGLLAIRLVYDVALACTFESDCPANGWVDRSALTWDDSEFADSSPFSITACYCLQVASEIAYEKQLCQSLSGQAAEKQAAEKRPTERKRLQMIFCIDVRSEVFRRHLESVDHGIETMGFAGFFGLPFEFVSLGSDSGAAQCPVLLNPGFQIHESIGGANAKDVGLAVNRRQTTRQLRTIWKSFQRSAASCFSFVESIGLTYMGKLLTDSLRITKPVASPEFDGVAEDQHHRCGPVLKTTDGTQLPLSQQITLAENMLRNLGLTDNFAEVVAICGHGADVVNNPYKSGLDCGACGGHSGEPNARVAALLLNNPDVRDALQQRGISIPEDTLFVAAIHNTTTDEIKFFDTADIAPDMRQRMQAIQEWTASAGQLCRTERTLRMAIESGAANPGNDVFRRSRDWAEVRPEWGLAGNAAFIVAPRSRTQGLNLAGRTFMHNYDHHNDPELRILELIMTAPMVVTSWINLQYYASAVDNRHFGSGNKLIHNLVGQFGVLEGNGGDLMTGLPWQSVHDGQQYQHEPLRLLVLIEAPPESVQIIIQRHAHVRHLVTNGWLSLVVLHESSYYRWTSQESWQKQNAVTCS